MKRAILLFTVLGLVSSIAWAETTEIVTYYPTTGGNNEHLNDLTVGPGFLGENPDPGEVLIETRLGIGTNNPQEQIQITGNLRLPATTAAGGVPSGGVIFSNTNRFIHNFGSGNFFAGTNAGNFTLTGSSNVGIGTNAMQSLTNGIQNVAVGPRAMESTTSGQRNSAFGMESLNNNTTGGLNTALGHNTLFFNQTGFDNTAVGYQALLNTTGSDNVAVGQNAGSNLLANANTTGSGNTFIGTRSGSGVAAQLTNATALGFEALVSASNALVLGGTGANAVNVGIGTETPAQRLHVVGTVQIVDGTQANGRVLTSDANGVASWQAATSVPVIANPTLAAPVWVRVGNNILFGNQDHEFMTRFTFATAGGVRRVRLTVTARNANDQPPVGTVFNLNSPTFRDGWGGNNAGPGGGYTLNWIQFYTQNPGNGNQLTVVAFGEDGSSGFGSINANVDVSYQ